MLISLFGTLKKKTYIGGWYGASPPVSPSLGPFRGGQNGGQTSNITISEKNFWGYFFPKNRPYVFFKTIFQKNFWGIFFPEYSDFNTNT